MFLLYRNPKLCANKLLCYTRQSHIISNLPLLYPSPLITNDKRDLLQDVVYEGLQSLVLMKVTPDILEGELERKIHQFMEGMDRNILLIVANMHDITTKMINHLRILVEQKESLAITDKLIVFFLHFPPVKFFDSCYPALFLSGWDHFYLDAITTKLAPPKGLPQTLNNVVDIRKCFQKCLGILPACNDQDAFTLCLKPLFEEAIPVISPKIVIGASHSKTKGVFNSRMSVYSRQTVIQMIFDTRIGDSLNNLFCHYWDESAMRKFLQDAARFTFHRQSTLSITSYIQTRIKALFFEFLVYILHRINEDCNLDTLGVLTDKWVCNKSVEMMFCEGISQFAITSPNLMSLPLNSHTRTPPQKPGFQFPFFHMIFHTLEEMVEGCQEEINVKRTQAHSKVVAKTTQQSMEDKLFEAMKKKLKSLEV